MRCVACNEPMIALELDRVEIDFCLSCQGIWLDRGELELLVPDCDSLAAAFSAHPNVSGLRTSRRRCPCCRRRMESVMVGQVEPVPLERCRRGHGLWLDGGELESVLAYFDPARHSRIIGLMREIFPHTRPKTEGLL